MFVFRSLLSFRRWSTLAALLGLLFMGSGRMARAQVTYDGGTLTTYSNTDYISPVAADSNGDLFYVDQSGSNNTLYKILPGGSPTALNSSFPYLPTALTVNSAGSTLYFIFNDSGVSCGGSTHYFHVGMVSTAANSTPSNLPDCFNFGTPTARFM